MDIAGPVEGVKTDGGSWLGVPRVERCWILSNGSVN